MEAAFYDLDNKVTKLGGSITEKETDMFTPKSALPNQLSVPTIWIVVGNHGWAKVFQKTDQSLQFVWQTQPSNDMEVEIELIKQSQSRIAGLIQDKSTRHEVEPCTKQSQQIALNFLYDLSFWLNEMEIKQAFDRLVLIAPPKILGDLRATMSDPVQARIAAEVNKDFTQLTMPKLVCALKKIIWL